MKKPVVYIQNWRVIPHPFGLGYDVLVGVPVNHLNPKAGQRVSNTKLVMTSKVINVDDRGNVETENTLYVTDGPAATEETISALWQRALTTEPATSFPTALH